MFASPCYTSTVPHHNQIYPKHRSEEQSITADKPPSRRPQAQLSRGIRLKNQAFFKHKRSQTAFMESIRTVWPNAPEPINFVYSKWYTDPYTFGCYSYAAVGSSNADFQALSEPVSKQDLVWSGLRGSASCHGNAAAVRTPMTDRRRANSARYTCGICSWHLHALFPGVNAVLKQQTPTHVLFIE